MSSIELEREVAVHGEAIRGLVAGQTRIEKKVDGFDAKLDTAVAGSRWTPAAKAAVIAPTIAGVFTLIALIITNGGPG